MAAGRIAQVDHLGQSVGGVDGSAGP